MSAWAPRAPEAYAVRAPTSVLVGSARMRADFLRAREGEPGLQAHRRRELRVFLRVLHERGFVMRDVVA